MSPYFNKLLMKYTFDYYLDNYCGEDTIEESCSSIQKSNTINLYKILFPSNTKNLNVKNNSSIELNNQLTYDNYKLDLDDILYSSYIRNGIKFIITDTSSYVSKSNKTILGSTQLNWLLSELSSSIIDKNVKAVILTFNQPFYYNSTIYEKDWIKQNYETMSDEFDNEKTIIANQIEKINYNNYNSSDYKPFIMIGSAKMVAFDTGINNPYGNFPIAYCGPIDVGKAECLGGPYSHGYSKDGDDQYCTIQIFSNNLKSNFKYNKLFPNTGIINNKTSVNNTEIINNNATVPNDSVVDNVSNSGNDKENNLSSTENYCMFIQGISSRNLDKKDVLVFSYNFCEPDKYFSNFKTKCPIIWREKIIHAFIVIGISILLFLFFYVFLYNLAAKTLDYKILKEDKIN